MVRKNVATTVEEMVEPLLEHTELELVDVEFLKEGSGYFLRVFIDKPGGVTLDDCEALSRKLDIVLEEKDPIPHAYTLEVSSPGIERTLKKRKDFEHFLGHKINVTTFAPIDGSKKFCGIIAGVDDFGITLEQDGVLVLIAMEQLAKAKLTVEF